MEQKKKIAEMTKEERAAYQREWYAKKLANNASKTLHLEIHNCTPELEQAIIAAITQERVSYEPKESK